MGEDCSERKVCWNVIVGESVGQNDLLGNSHIRWVVIFYLYFIYILFTEALWSC